MYIQGPDVEGRCLLITERYGRTNAILGSFASLESAQARLAELIGVTHDGEE